ncbi:MAG: type II toxin-antitoxin system PemK/MazF family toxin [Actinomycetia bacterium]|nr:type II toxin-antitoxin system PemK/MazF family toxin [Actinomycetes bacterium]
MPSPRRGDVWLVAFGAARHGEIGRTRPAVVLTIDDLQRGTLYDRITVVPFTTNPRQRPTQLQPLVPAGEGVDRDSVALCDAPRSFVPSRFVRHLGAVSDDTLSAIVQARALIEGWDD